MFTGKFIGKPRCPYCSATLDGFAGTAGSTPRKGDLTVCAYCFEILVFADSHGNLRRISADEVLALDNETMEDLVAKVFFLKENRRKK